jgi:hypothetical protein
MKNLGTLPVGLAAFALGGLLGATTGHALAAPAGASADAPPIVYFCFESYGIDDLNRKANTAAADGWHLVTGGGNTWCFTRYSRR